MSRREAQAKFVAARARTAAIVRGLDPVRAQLAGDPVRDADGWRRYKAWLRDYKEKLRSLQRIATFDPGPQNPRW